MAHNKTLALLAAVTACAASAVDTWYVDAVNGNDGWNGKADISHADQGLGIGPKRTLAVFTNLLAKGDTIYVAPGWYTNGVANSNFRFFSDKGNISLIATGDASNTFIGGAADKTVEQATAPYGCGANAVVPVKMTGGGNLVRGLTLTGGRQVKWENSASYYGGGAVFDSSKNTDCMVDCVVTNCIANRGGGVYHLGNALRCRFAGNMAENGAHAQGLNCAVNCVFENAEGYAVLNAVDGSRFINCLCRGNTAGNFRTTAGTINVYNSVFLKGGTTIPKNKACAFSNCFFDFDPTVLFAAFEAIVGTNGECRVFATGSLKFNADGSPYRGNPVIDAGIASYYNDNFPLALDASEKAFDIVKSVRTSGEAMDMGPFERNAESADDDEWFVDAANGDDSNSGKTSAQAFRTLARASTNALMEAGATVHVAEGVYSDGVVPAIPEVDATASRMLVGYQISFVATGRREATVIEGASDSTASGIGPGAVRCCLMRGGIIRGFTLRNGNVNAGSKTEDDKGGGIKCTSSAAYVYDCEIYGCNAVRGGGVQGATLVRCYVHDNTNVTTGIEPARSAAGTDAFGCIGYNSVVKGDCYTGSLWLNCTLLGKCWGSGTTFANCYIGTDGATVAGVAASFTNCVCAGAFKAFTTKGGCVENSPCLFDSSWRPRRHRSPIVNAGDGALYAARFPESLSAFRDIDYAGGERVLEGRIDVGAGEMIWDPVGMTISFR